MCKGIKLLVSARVLSSLAPTGAKRLGTQPLLSNYCGVCKQSLTCKLLLLLESNNY